MRQRIKMSALRVLGVALVIAGIAGLFLPVLQGILFILLGLYLVTLGNTSFHERLRSHASRAPSLLEAFDAFDRKVRRWIGLE